MHLLPRPHNMHARTQALLEVNAHMTDLRRDAGKGEEEGDVLEILPIQLLFGTWGKETVALHV